MDLVLQVLDWAKGKDVTEIYYENRSSSSPIVIHLVFSLNGPASNRKPSQTGYLHSPAIGKLSLLEDKSKVGASVQPGDLLGFVQGEGEKTDIRSQMAGKVREALAASGSAVSFGQPILIMELRET